MGRIIPVCHPIEMASRRNPGIAEQCLPGKVESDLSISVLHAASNLWDSSFDLLLTTKSSAQAPSASQTTLLAAANRTEKNMLIAIDGTSNKLQSDMATLMQQMDLLKLQDSTCETLFANFRASHADALSRLSLGIETIILEQGATRATGDRQRAELAQKRICMSLSFPDMDSRRNQIREAHEDTYHWILEPRDTTDDRLSDFRTWLDSPAPDHGLFWISGKPGSGKSTLLQYLDHNLNLLCCTNWFSGYDLFVCRYFFWAPGRTLQKSFQGLLQALLYQLLSSHQWLIETVVSEERWLTACTTESELQWSVPELKMAIEACVQRVSTTRKILILVDGLDELDGTDDDRHDMLDYLGRLPHLGPLKLCLSSRPWNIFADYFQGLPQLQLQLFTRVDIEKYVRKSLSHSMRLQSSYLRNSGAGEKLVQTIVDKASGVFLWVRLVVQECVRGFRDGETIRTLERKVDSMPADLDGFFKRIISSIEPAYRSEASAFIQTALFCQQNPDVEWPRGLLELTFLEADDADFAMRPSYNFTELDLGDLDALEYRIDLGKRRLNSRCMGLLEWADSRLPLMFGLGNRTDSSKRLQTLLSTEVNFLHRSLVDFLLTTDAQSILRQCTNGPFPAQRFLRSAMLTKVCAVCAICPTPSRQHLNDEVDMFPIKYLYNRTDALVSAMAYSMDLDVPTVNIIMTRLKPILELLHHARRSLQELTRLQDMLDRLDSADDLCIGMGIGYNLTDYVAENLTTDMTKGNRGQSFLEIALGWLHPEMVRAVLQAGVDPNYPKSIWWEWLRMLLKYETLPISISFAEVLEIMIRDSVDISCPPYLLPQIAKHGFKPGPILLTDVLEALKLPEPDRQRLLTALREREQAKAGELEEAGNSAVGEGEGVGAQIGPLAMDPNTTPEHSTARKRKQPTSSGVERNTRRRSTVISRRGLRVSPRLSSR
jgi:hypothetical protein